ncbi:Glucose-methanol-choline oxidoreductase [Penicillium hordei]|uniref:Glucose-methanol-choline oxidoreductase n=1 Tax=Penicillium hordei TaxID=40994 RepID=A0AAD6DTM0_9EURO|nr:Glucose-methanol-choline oxidoreductase [Penicillium hordei]KAJ5592806.1 Glucose-methanol-choline oxidoreductase [Penicillium hordei]
MAYRPARLLLTPLHNQILHSNSTNGQTPDAFSPTGGPLEVSFRNAVHAFRTRCQKAFIVLGMNRIDGFNSGGLLSSAFAAFTIDPRNAQRSSSESSFLQAMLDKGAGPTVYKNTMAHKALFDHDNKHATEVQLSTEGTFGSRSVNFTLHALTQALDLANHLRNLEFPYIKNPPGVGQKIAFNGYNLNEVTADPKDGHQYATLSGALVAPLSRGSVRLAGPNMNTPPLIGPQWFVDPTDKDLAIRAAKRHREIWAELAKLRVADQESTLPLML